MNHQSTQTRGTAEQLVTRKMLLHELASLDDRVAMLNSDLERAIQDKERVRILLKTIETSLIEAGVTLPDA